MLKKKKKTIALFVHLVTCLKIKYYLPVKRHCLFVFTYLYIPISVRFFIKISFSCYIGICYEDKTLRHNQLDDDNAIKGSRF